MKESFDPKQPAAWPHLGVKLTRPQKSDSPFLSIIIPSYEQGDFLETAIRSVLCQGFDDFELLIFDGGSTDQSPAIIEKYSSYLAHFEVTPDRGQAHAINKGIKRARGLFVGWINADDFYRPDTFSILKEYHQAQPNALLFHGNQIHTNERNQVIGWTRDVPVKLDQYSCILRSEASFWHHSLSKKSGGLKEDYHYALDIEFFLRLSLESSPFLIDKPLAYYRCHQNTKTSTGKKEGRKETKKAYEENCPQYLNKFDLIKRRPRWEHYLFAIKHPIAILIPFIISKLQTDL